MEALVLEKKDVLALRDFDVAETLGPHDVRIALRTVGICGSDVHYYTHGAIGQFIVREPMILGHEASGVVVEVGDAVTNLKAGDRVCMEPGIPDPNSKATLQGMYNLDPAVRFWATPPVHGILRPTVVHPAAFTFKLPDNVSFAEGAMVEPVAVGMHAATKARIKPGDVAIVMGAGPIGMVTALAALAGGCSQIIMTDVQQPKLDLAATLGPITPVNIARENLKAIVDEMTDGWGANLVFECSGNEKAAASVFAALCPGGAVVYVGIPLQPIAYDVAAAMVKEARVEHVFRYAHVYPRAIALMASGKLDVKPLITDTFRFADSVEAFDFAVNMPPTSVKAQIVVAE
ncbi:MAG: NAD(P)-dependent alcohol dehydrogenase [Caldilinea sp.]|nr:NAD(P)-dependent alcohol dehydrogenase [Caldilinea sp.]MCB0151216.1 NAD(P)-dependent alcohol dehydrogenase [Caldilineaceae bacterium]MCB0038261.1 NAD(P)-dependent alcohol dehydrogenase [Caldilinea sp.]MCB9113957.1 NAD(P)-dependent alcohol dehydrogenase [Caldilineaceae bacterium]MCB9118554.1 NAD(P)-dependent alcohol dehydrogenase [Caldilineaceae bacterium]